MPLISSQFFALAFLAILSFAVTGGLARTLLFLALNLVFVASYLSPVGILSTLLFCLAGYLFIRLAMAGKSWAMPLGIALLTAAFVYMRNYAFLGLVLPKSLLTNVFATVGLSFLLFKILQVLIDARAGLIKTCRPLDFANYCLNFTTFLIGPIQRFEAYTAQWSGEEQTRPRDFDGALAAVNRILRGLVKKFVLAEWLAPFIANTPTTDYRAIALSAIFLKSYAFYAYLYCDFSGYCDIVIGIGTLMGLRPPENFFLPFFSRNVADFWLRVHRSLTHWLTSYVFTPIYSWGLRSWNSRGAAVPALLFAIMVTMVVSGLWHGTTLAFLIFGIVHGCFLVAYRLYDLGLRSALPGARGLKFVKNPAVSAASIFLTFNVCSLAYLCFILSGRQLGQVAAKLLRLP